MSFYLLYLYFLRKCNSIKKMGHLTEVLILFFFFFNLKLEHCSHAGKCICLSACPVLWLSSDDIDVSASQEQSMVPFSALKQLCVLSRSLFYISEQVDKSFPQDSIIK